MKIYSLISFITWLILNPVLAQEWIQNITNPNPPPFVFSIAQETFQDSKARFFSDSLEYSKTQAKIVGPINDSTFYRNIFQTEYVHHQFKESNPDMNSPVPSNLYEVHLGHTFLYKEEEKKIWGLNSQINSKSDKLYSEMNVVDINLTAFRYWASSVKTAWMLSLNYSSNRDFIGDHIPIPGFQYIYTPKREIFLILGIPGNGFTWQFADSWKWSYFAFLWNQNMRLSYFIAPPIEIYTQFTYRPTSFRLKGASDDDKQVFLESKRLIAGFKFPLSQNLQVDIYGGKLYDFRLYQTESFGDEKDWLEELEDQEFFNIQLGIRI